jgi:cation-transporting ATPase E
MVAAELDAGPGTAGLTEAEAADRHARGLGNEVPAAPTRTVGEILRANVLTPFNFLLGGLLVVILVVGPIQDAVFGLLLIANSATGVIQELRARRSLDRLAVLNAPKARLVRDGVVREAALNEVVRDDVLDLRPGDQVVVDGTVLAGSGLEIDESLLTGESDPVVRSRAPSCCRAASPPPAAAATAPPGSGRARTRQPWPRRPAASPWPGRS